MVAARKAWIRPHRTPGFALALEWAWWGGSQGASRAADRSRVELFSPDQISCHCDFSGKHSLSPPKTSCPQQTVAFSNCEVGVLWAALSPPEALVSHPDPVALIGSLSGPMCGCPHPLHCLPEAPAPAAVPSSVEPLPPGPLPPA